MSFLLARFACKRAAFLKTSASASSSAYTKNLTLLSSSRSLVKNVNFSSTSTLKAPASDPKETALKLDWI